MATSTYEIWFLVSGCDTLFSVIASSTIAVRQLSDLIQAQLKDDILRDIDARYLIHRKVKDGVTPEAYKNESDVDKFRLKTDGDLHPRQRLREIWPNQPSGHLHVIIYTPSVIPRGPFISPHLEPASHLYKELWGKGLDSITDKLPGRQGAYVSRSHVASLRLRDLGFNEEALLVRNEYVTTLKTLADESTSIHCEGTVVAGQKGAGKSCFLFFTLLHRLCSGQPTAFQISDSFIVFGENGVTAHYPQYPNSDLLPKGTWALVDSEHPCKTFLMAANMKLIFIVKAASIMPLHFKPWTDFGRVLPYVMNTFSSLELISLGKVLDLDGEALVGHSRRWGPSARICLDLQRGHLESSSLTSKVITSATAFVNDFGRTDDLQVMTLSDILFAVRPRGPHIPDRYVGIATVATDYFNQVVTEAAADADPDRRVKFYKMLTIRAGFESSALYMLRNFFCAWFFNGQKSPNLRCSAPPGTRSRFSVLPICKDVHRMTNWSSLKRANDLQAPFGWLLISQSFAFADAIICTDKYIITVKVTVSSAIKVDRIGFSRMQNNLPGRFQTNRTWIHVFVTDNEDKAMRLRIQQFKFLAEKDISVYSAVLDIHQISLSAEDLRRVEEARISCR